MSCNYPLLAERGELQPSGKFKFLPIGRYSPELKERYPDSIMVPCGKCAGCRADYTRQWADRMMLELDHSGRAVFVTLTYDDKHLPQFLDPESGELVMTLSKRDWQLFMKSFRKYFAKRGVKEVRFYMCGEYGSLHGRPHMHAIIYGIGLDDFPDLQMKGINELGDQYWISETLEKDIWKRGFCLLADVSWQTMAYVARYVRKKQFGQVDDGTVQSLKEPVFCLMSRRPGIGMYYPIEHPDAMSKAKYYLSSSKGSVEVWMPDVFLKQYETLDPAGYKKLKEQRMKFAEDAQLAKLKQTDVEFTELVDRDFDHMEESGKFIDSFQKLL